MRVLGRAIGRVQVHPLRTFLLSPFGAIALIEITLSLAGLWALVGQHIDFARPLGGDGPSLGWVTYGYLMGLCYFGFSHARALYHRRRWAYVVVGGYCLAFLFGTSYLVYSSYSKEKWIWVMQGLAFISFTWKFFRKVCREIGPLRLRRAP